MAACWFNAVCFQHVGHSRITNVEADIGQGTLDAIVASGGIFLCKSQDRIDDDLTDAWASDCLSFLAVVPLLHHQLTVPAKNRIGRK